MLGCCAQNKKQHSESEQMHFPNYETHIFVLIFGKYCKEKGLESKSSNKRGFALYVRRCFHAECLLCIQRQIPHQSSSSVNNISKLLYSQEGCFIKHLQDSSAYLMTCVLSLTSLKAIQYAHEGLPVQSTWTSWTQEVIKSPLSTTARSARCTYMSLSSCNQTIITF